MKRIAIPTTNWHTALAAAIALADPGTIIIVHTEDMRELAEIAAGRLGKTGLVFEIEIPDPREETE